MSAVLRAARGGLGGRRLQAVIIGLVVLAATAASTLALGMLADAHSPFDHAFAVQRGADVAVTVDTAVATPADLTAAAKVAGVTAVAGPFATSEADAQVSTPGVTGTMTAPLRIVARLSPGGPVDDLTLEAGHWPSAGSQIVIGANAPGQLGSVITVGKAKLSVVGIADSVTSTADAWVLPAGLPAMAGPGGPGQAQLLYRFAASATSGDISADIAAVRAVLPAGAVVTTVSYLTARQSQQSSVAPWVPFIVAFGVIALFISVLIVLNVVGGAVVAGTARIGVLKSVGFTPAQVVAAYVLLVAVPAAGGAAVGVVCGNLLAIPLLRQNAQVYQVGVLGVPFWVDAAVPLAVLMLTAVAAIGPALRAGRMSAVQAIATGRAPRPRHGYLAQRLLARLAVAPRPVTLGLASPAARPGRTLVTVVAVLSGAAAVTFGAGLATSLNRAYNDISRSTALPVRVSALPPGVTAGVPGGPGVPGVPGGPGGSGGPGAVAAGNGGKTGEPRAVLAGAAGLTAAQQRAIATAITAQPGTGHYLTVSRGHLPLAGTANGMLVTAYGGGNPDWSGYALISGRWYSPAAGAREVDVNTLFLTDTGTSVGGTYAMVSGGRTVTVTIAGEVFAPGNDVRMFASLATLAAIDPAASAPVQYAVALRPGVQAQAYANGLSAALGPEYTVVADGTGGGRALLAVTSLVAMLTLAIIVVAGLGVLNTVALQIRERAHDIGVLKALGMTPRQTVTMITCSVAITGLAAGVIAVPAGILLHHGMIPAMTHAANSGYPPSLISVYSAPELVALALAGVLIAVAGALAPASWAAGSRTATALRAE